MMRLDFSSKQIRRIEWSLFDVLESEDDRLRVETLLFDSNQIAKLEHLDIFCNLKHLSLANNDLTEVRAIARLTHLEFVNLVNNALTCLDGFKNLKHLKWLNVSGNCIKSLDVLRFNVELEYIDASENEITAISDFSALTNLVTLNLNRNYITTLRAIPKNLPKEIANLFLAENLIDDLNEIGYLTVLNKLENLSIYNNSCLAYAPGYTLKNHEFIFDYRPFVINWCLDLVSLDGAEVTQKEYLKAEWLFSQGKGRHFRPGQHAALIDYLTKSCPFGSADLVEEDLRLSKVLEKKVTYQTETAGPKKDHEPAKSTPTARSSVPSEFSLAVASHDVSSVPELDAAPLSRLSPSGRSGAGPVAVVADSYEALGSSQPEAKNYQLDNSSNESFDDFDAAGDGEDANGYEEEEDEEDRERRRPDGRRLQHDSSMADSDPNNINKSRYDDYDNRPIKPLDKNLFEKQLSQYTEMSAEEMEQLKTKINSFKRTRSKTTENIKIPQQKSFNQPKRQVSMNMGSSRNQAAGGGGDSDEHRFEFKKRSKTQEDFTKPARNAAKPAAVVTPRKPATAAGANRTPVVNSGGVARANAVSRYNPDRYSPRLANVNSRYLPATSSPSSSNLSRNSSRKDSGAKEATGAKPSLLARLEQDESFMKNPLRRTTTISTTTSEDDEKATSKGKREAPAAAGKGPQSFEKYVAKYSSGSDSSAASREKPKKTTTLTDQEDAALPSAEFQKLSMTEQLKQLKFHAKLKKQRQEMLLTMQKKLDDFKNNQRKEALQKQQQQQQSSVPKASAVRKEASGADSEWEERCATRIQSAWRGYTVRKDLKELLRQRRLVKCHSIQSQVHEIKASLHRMLEDHREICQFNADATQRILSTLRNFSANTTLTSECAAAVGSSEHFEHLARSKIAPVEPKGELLRENEELRSKLRALENRYQMLETKLQSLTLTSEVGGSGGGESKAKSPRKKPSGELGSKEAADAQQQPRLEIYPPLRVRLQKLNEKSVALKWDHNPLNLLIDLEGYHVYINEELCGTMKAVDTIASINGIQEEGEYRIHLRAFYGDVESAKSNEVITRVKKKGSSSNKSSLSKSAKSSSATLANETTTNMTINETTTANTTALNESSRKSTPRKRTSLTRSADSKPQAGDDEKENDRTLDSLTPSTTHGDLLRASTTTTSSSTTGSLSGRPPKANAPPPPPPPAKPPSEEEETAPAPPPLPARKSKQNILTVADNLIKNLGRAKEPSEDKRDSPDKTKPNESTGSGGSPARAQFFNSRDHVTSSDIFEFDKHARSPAAKPEEEESAATAAAPQSPAQQVNYISEGFDVSSSNVNSQPTTKKADKAERVEEASSRPTANFVSSRHRPTKSHDLSARFFAAAKPSESFASQLGDESEAPVNNNNNTTSAASDVADEPTTHTDNTKYDDNFLLFVQRYTNLIEKFEAGAGESETAAAAAAAGSGNMMNSPRSNITSFLYSAKFSTSEPNLSAVNLLRRSQMTNGGSNSDGTRDDSFVRKSLSFSEENDEEAAAAAAALEPGEVEVERLAELGRAKLPPLLLNDSEVVDPAQVVKIVPHHAGSGDDHIRI